MRTYLELGPCPCEEDAIQVNPDTPYQSDMISQVNRYVRELKFLFPPIPGTSITPKSFFHDFGVYWEAVVNYDDDDEKQVEYAINIENNLPVTWTK